MSGFVIEKGIPMPRKREKFPLSQMDVGDSFFLSLEQASAARMAIWRFKKINNQTIFSTRRDGGGLRIFRMPDATTGAMK